MISDAEFPIEVLRAWDRAMRGRSVAAEPAIAAALRGTPGAFAVLSLFRGTKAYQATQATDRVKVKKAMAEPELRELASLLARPSWEAVLMMEKASGRNYGLLDHWKDGPSGMTDLVCEALGVELPSPPTFQSIASKFMKGRR